jgi:hypothetical protein
MIYFLLISFFLLFIYLNNMRKWAWNIYKTESNSSSELSAKIKKPCLLIDQKYEQRVLANLDKRLCRIEKEKRRLQENYSDSDLNSPIEIVKFKIYSGEARDKQRGGEMKSHLVKKFSPNASSQPINSMKRAQVHFDLTNFSINEIEDNGSSYVTDKEGDKELYLKSYITYI